MYPYIINKNSYSKGGFYTPNKCSLFLTPQTLAQGTRSRTQESIENPSNPYPKTNTNDSIQNLTISIQNYRNPYLSSLLFSFLLPSLLFFFFFFSSSSLLFSPPICSPKAQIRDPKWVLFGLISPLLHFSPQVPFFLQINSCYILL